MLNLGKKPIVGAYYGSQKIGSMYVGSKKIYGGGSRPSVPGFVGGWKTYGRSNSEDPAKREILPDYSGNGRDIKLYNFAFSGMSGYGGFNQALLNETVQVSPAIYLLRVSDVFTADGTIEVELTGMKEGAKCIFRNLALDSTIISTRAAITTDGKYTVEVKQDCRLYAYIGEAPSDPAASLANYTIHFLPEYPGGLVSDGVDDYGQCVKGFALPDDYTVVAVRKMLISSDTAPFVAKSNSASNGAFIMEYSKETLCYSYGAASKITNNVPILFSYQMKNRYNGITINKGSSRDIAHTLSVRNCHRM